MDVIEQLAKELLPALQKAQAGQYGVGYKHDATGVPTGQYIHGPGGNLAFPGVDPSVFHTVVGNKGILGQLPATPSQYTNPTYYVITGVTGDTGSEQNAVCERPPSAGLKKTCLITSVFGRYSRSTREIEFDRVGKLRDRADPMDLVLVGSPIAQSGVFNTGPESVATPEDLLKNEIKQLMWERNVSLHRLVSVQLWQGNPVNNSVGGGYMEMTGFDQLINTGYVDAQTNQRCYAVDSDLKNFNYGRIDNAAGGTSIVATVSAAYHYVKDLAERTGVMPVRWVLAMRSTMFYELTAVWPCSYLTYRCQVTGDQEVVVQGTEQVRMRDEMRAGKYLLIDGERIEVVLDDGIAEATNTTNANVVAGCFASDIYLIPMSVVGGRGVTYLEYADYNAAPMRSVLQAGAQEIMVEGAFATTLMRSNWCIYWITKLEPRLVMRTPWLAARIQNVQVCPLQHEREPFPADPYFTDGGVVGPRPGPSYYTPWKNRAAQ